MADLLLNTKSKQSLLTPSKPWLQSLFWNLGLPLAFVAIVFFFYPYNAIFELSTDEGINLMKGMLVDQGFSLYGQIWSDQPPLFTYLLVGAFHFFGYKVGVARFIVLLISALCLWGVTYIVRQIAGNRYALAAAGLLFWLPKYMVLSVSVMIGLPSITFAVLSLLGIILWHKNRQHAWLWMSALALGLSVLTKLFTGFLAPVFVVGLVIAEYAQSKGKRDWLKILLPAFEWGIIFTIFTAGLGILLVGVNNIPQLITVHLAGNEVVDFQKTVYFDINWHLQTSVPVLLLTLMGSIYAILTKRWLFLYPIAWMAIAYLLLTQHSPVWEHQMLLVTVPAVLPASLAVILAVQTAAHMVRKSFANNAMDWLMLTALVALFILLFRIRIPEPFTILTPTPTVSNTTFVMGPLQEKFFIRMVKYAPETNWVATDLPMYAFRAKLPVPPELAVLSAKRFETGSFTDQDMLNSIQKWDPEQVLLGRFNYPITEQYLVTKYRLVHFDDNVKLYVRNDLSGTAERNP